MINEYTYNCSHIEGSHLYKRTKNLFVTERRKLNQSQENGWDDQNRNRIKSASDLLGPQEHSAL